MEEQVRVFECARGDDVDLVLERSASWALVHDDAVVVLEGWEVSVWHAVVESTAINRLTSRRLTSIAIPDAPTADPVRPG